MVGQIDIGRGALGDSGDIWYTRLHRQYDCAGGMGSAKYFAPCTRVWGDDPYSLDDDSDGVGCEPS